MPRVKPLVPLSKDAEARKAARERAEAEEMPRDEFCRKIDALEKIAGCKNHEAFASVIGVSPRRLRYLRAEPDAVKLIEAVRIQALAAQYGMAVFKFGV